MRVVISLFNMYKGGSLSIYEEIEKNIDSHANAYLIVFGKKFSLTKNKLVVCYPIRYLNWLYRLLIENICASVYGYALNADRLVMMGNFPSFFWFRSQIVFFHNTLYLSKEDKFDSVKLWLEKKLFKLLMNYKKPVVFVQTAYIETLFKENFGERFRVRVVGSPILKERRKKQRKLNIDNNYKLSFIYPAYYYPHKNHKFLLNKNDLFKELNCELILTISSEDAALGQLGLNHVKFVGSVDRNELLKLYNESNALVFPSLNESLGMPLLEAELFGLPIIAPNLPYVNAVLSNYYAYDVGDDVSFCNTVRACAHDIRNGCAKLSRPLVSTNVVNFIECMLK
jgi:glycosyltransferase involved in cell wall biosynthesis